MFGLGMGEIAIILVLALLLLGPQKLPDAAKQLGKGLREFKKATDDLKQQFESELYASDAPKPSKPTLVETPHAEEAAAAMVPVGGIPAVAGEVPPAHASNVPGLEAALVEVEPPAALAPVASPAAPAADTRETAAQAS
ncbi:MAG TPA: twin-arginine translocase TatA/TatE family subunit [Anaeromyxobacteraceae bacterium]|nr:twin-arginine translocase TatA/TatE family subunit [Anaeromyxobacteraceae bacterium]